MKLLQVPFAIGVQLLAQRVRSLVAGIVLLRASR